jgi:hypothetical protein
MESSSVEYSLTIHVSRIDISAPIYQQNQHFRAWLYHESKVEWCMTSVVNSGRHDVQPHAAGC